MSRGIICGIRAAVILAAGLTIGGTSAFAAAGDYDGDGLSDVSMVSVSRSSRTTDWKVLLSSGSTASYHFGIPGDALTPGTYYSSGQLIPGIVFVRDARKPLEWYFKTSASASVKRRFGTPGMQPVPGDYDGDGRTDMAVRDSSASTAYWTIALSSGKTLSRIAFGSRAERAFAADVDGDGVDEMVTIRNLKGKLYFRWRKANSAKSTSVQWGMAGDIPLRPMDMNGDGKPDLIVVRAMSGNNVAFVRYDATSSAMVTVGKSGTIPMTGNFTGSNGFAYYDRGKGKLTIIHADGSESSEAFGSSTDALVRPDGSVVQPGEDERFGSSSSGGGSGDIECDSTFSGHDGSGGFTNNPVNSKNSIKVILPARFTGDVSSVKATKDGQVLDTLNAKSPNEWGNRQRFYGDHVPSWYPKDLLLVITRLSGKTECVTIPDPAERLD